ncbi:hypothetical protein V6C03_00550 [Methyloligella sp. 2.7D]|uniref:hypothetical protein n=1 Tax=unclassified Methyloligella TaxID=2625955 RepID=UPI00157CDF19|nr:hypothetical protein [Methyloligella sp. GL2]QKP76838.1 hypothetical protein HT051_04865 [Methyloligella sp. GL2]
MANKTLSRAAKNGTSLDRTGGKRYLSSKRDVVQFKAAARAYLEKHAKSKELALEALQAMGMVTAKGRLTKHYR